MKRISHRSLLTAALLLPATAAFPQPAKQEFPEGPGKQIVSTVCNGCHDANRVRAGYSPQGWNTVVAMMQNIGAPVPPEEWPAVAAYLMKNFPEQKRPAAVILDGPVKASFKLWDLPTLGSRPHDPLATHDGMIWWTGQLANKLGRIDPKNNTIREYELKSPATGPHGLVEDRSGNIWFTGNHAGLIGMLDPNTGVTTEYRLPDPKAKDPHTIAIAPDGRVWFTVQQGNMIGRINPKTGEIKLVNALSRGERPYGLLINSKGIPVTVMFGTNKVATLDPETMEIKEYVLPNPASRPRRLALEGDDIVWYTDFSRGYLGRLDLKTGEQKEWASPSGPGSQPYGIVMTKGALWYCESRAMPNTIVRFDPKTEKFQSWAIPGGGDIVRNMSVAPDGNPVTANSLVNQVGLIEVH